MYFFVLLSKINVVKKVALLFFIIIAFSFEIIAQCPPNYTVAGDSTCGTGTITLSASGCSGCDYQWYDSLGNIMGSNQATVSTTVAGATLFYLYVNDPVNGCDNIDPVSGYPDSVMVNIYPAPGDTSIYGNWKWNVYCFDGLQLDSYQGYYIDNNLNVNSTNFWDPMYSPSYHGPTYYDPNTDITVVAPGYKGCDIPVDNHSIYYRRKGFPPGYYQLFIRHDDDALVFIDKKMIYAKSWPQDGRNIWQGYLDSNSTIDFIWNDHTVTSIGKLSFNPISPPADFSAGIVNSNQIVCNGGDPSVIQVGKKISPSNDAFAFASDPNTVYGHNNDLDIRVCSNCGSNSTPDTQWVYISFNLSEFSKASSAFLNLAANTAYPTYYPGYPAYIYAVADTTWSENTITWNNKPAFGALLDSCLIIDHNIRYYTWNLSNYVQSQLSLGRKKVSFMIRVLVDNTVTIHFRSKEDTQYVAPPFLYVNIPSDTCNEVSYQWQSQNGCSGSFIDIPGATASSYDPPAGVATNTCYRVFAKDQCSSGYSDTLTITVSNPVTPSVTSAARCGSGSLSLTASGASSGTYRWYDAFTGGNLVGVGSVCTTPVLNTSDSFYVSVQDAYLCEGGRAKANAVIDQPTNAGTLSASANNVCIVSNSGSIHLNGYIGTVSSWLTSTDNFMNTNSIASSIDSLSFTNLSNSTAYKAIVQSGTCSADTSSPFLITVSPASVGGDIAVTSYDVNGGTLSLKNYQGNVLRWEYSTDSSFSTYSIINETNAHLSFTKQPTTYYRALVQLGFCATVYSSIIRVDALIIYSAVSPNGDGYNDTWVIEGIEDYPQNKVLIFNRLGSLVYKEDGYDNQERVWKGLSNVDFTLGNSLPDGTYFYQVEVMGSKIKTGYVVLKKN